MIAGAQIEVAIRRLEDERCAAMVAADATALSGMFSEGLVYTHLNAQRDDKTSYLQLIRSGSLSYESISNQIDTVLVSAKMAAVISRIEGRAVLFGETRLLRMSALSVWVKEDRWRLAAFQPTPENT
ncbi:MAG TPA: nuclear transport factor 2 family protein [Galbitalea sp.]|jgi:hypothetical protein|nr:nuclear transport factor 2 family protein [Galbitalea sp.]